MLKLPTWLDTNIHLEELRVRRENGLHGHYEVSTGVDFLGQRNNCPVCIRREVVNTVTLLSKVALSKE